MKMRTAGYSGSVLMATLVIIGLVTIMATAYLTLTGRQNYLAMRSTAWNSEIPIAEAGIEEAMAHLNSMPATRGVNGWTFVGDGYAKQRTLGDGYYYTVISTATPPTITSIGFGRIPNQNGYSYRTVMVTTQPASPGTGILAKESVRQTGNVMVDSYNSTDPLYSTGGRYDPAKHKDQASVGCLSSQAGAVNVGNAILFGNIATGPGGTAVTGSSGVCGDFAYGAAKTNLGTIQSGHFRDDLNVSIADVGVPFTGGYTIPSLSKMTGKTFAYVLGDGDFQLSSLANSVVVTGNARLYVTGNAVLGKGQSINVYPGGSLELYLGGPSAALGGNGVFNPSGMVKNCKIYGLPGLTDFTLGGSSAFYGIIYCPQAAVKINGTPSVNGALVGNTINMVGAAEFHYDEGVAPMGGGTRIRSWVEL